MKTDVVSGLVSLAATYAVHAAGLTEALAIYAFLALLVAPTVGFAVIVLVSMARPRAIPEVL